MKFTIDRTTLSDALSNASKASAVRSTIPALEGVLICLKNEMITITGYDLEIGIKCIVVIFIHNWISLLIVTFNNIFKVIAFAIKL